MKKGLSTLTILLLFFCAKAQEWKWGRYATGEGEGYCAAVDSGRNVYAAGVHWLPVTFDTISFPGYGVHLVKYNSSGGIKWAVVSHGSSNPVCVGLAVDNFGHEYMLGAFSGNISFGPFTIFSSGTSYNYFLAKFDAAGHTVWLKRLGNMIPFYYMQAEHPLVTDNDGNIFLTCSYSNNAVLDGFSLPNADPANNTADIMLARLTSEGTVIWAKSIGGSRHDMANGLAVTSGKELLVTGYFQSDSVMLNTNVLMQQDTGFYAMTGFCWKLDSMGSPIWWRNYRKTMPTGVANDNSGNVFFTGNYWGDSIAMGGITLPMPQSVTTFGYGFLTKLDAGGTEQWVKIIRALRAMPWNVKVDPCDNVWVLSTMGGSLITNVDTIDGYFLSPLPGSGDPNFIASWSNGGTLLQVVPMMSGSTDDPNSMVIDRCGNVVVVADIENCTVVYVGPDTITNLHETMIVLKYDPGLGCVDCPLVGGPTTGNWDDTVKDSGWVGNGSTGLGGVDIDLTEGTDTTIGIHNTTKARLYIYPNPTTGRVFINSSHQINSIILTDLPGRLIRSFAPGDNSTTIDISDLTRGIYMLRINDEVVRKLIKL